MAWRKVCARKWGNTVKVVRWGLARSLDRGQISEVGEDK
jgi:hypothetical protein